MKYYLNGKEITLEELDYAFNGLLDGAYCRQTMEVKKIENGGIYFTIVNHIDNRLNAEVKKWGVANYYLHDDGKHSLKLPEYTAKIEIGDLTIQLQNKTFTDEQIKNMREMLGWEVTNL